MKRWALVVAGLYFLILAALTVPAIELAFGSKVTLAEAVESYLFWPYWVWLVVMVVSQAALLSVPVRVARRRAVSRSSLLRTILAGGLMMGGLAAGAGFSIYEFAFRDREMAGWVGWGLIGLAGLIWCVWSVVFFRMTRNESPSDVISRLCRLLLKGSILELLIAVPTHIVARYRDYCCAGFMTFFGLTMGVSVMLFSFGPAVFFLFAERWRRLHPKPPGGAVPAGACR